MPGRAVGAGYVQAASTGASRGAGRVTAEVAVANRTGIALAADSAVTVTKGGVAKVINGANKLFRLNDRLSIAFMFYGNADLSGAPLEALLKHFRGPLGNQTYPTLDDYAFRLWQYIETEVPAFDMQNRRNDMLGRVQEFLSLVSHEIRSEIHRQSVAPGRRRLPKTIARDVTMRHERVLRSVPDSDRIAPADADAARAPFQPAIDTAIGQTFQPYGIDPATTRRIQRCVRLLLRKVPRMPSSIGIVIAGYPDGALYPSIKHYTVSGFVGDTLSVHERPSVEIGDSTTVGIWPYAQGEMVYSFMEGIDPSLWRMISAFVSAALHGVQDASLQAAQPFMSATDFAQLQGSIGGYPDAFASAFDQEIRQIRMRDFSDPVLDALRFLPKEQLAEVAESFVNLTSFRRRVSLDLETVGGAIDVAVISPGDGFVWIRRKHYFDPALNPGFFMRYR